MQKYRTNVYIRTFLYDFIWRDMASEEMRSISEPGSKHGGILNPCGKVLIMLNYNKLYYFYIITESANLYDAAERLCISQPALSKAIRDLETEFHVTLFEHSGRTLKLTSAGEVLRRECAGMFRQEASLIKSMRAAISEETVTLKLGFMLYKELDCLIPVIEQFNQEFSKIQIEITPYVERMDLGADILSGKTDIGLGIYSSEDIIPELEYKPLAETHLSIIANQNHPLAKKKTIYLPELKDEKFIFLGTGSHSSEYRFAREWCRKSGFEPHIFCSFDWIGAVLIMIQSGCGISILSDFAPLAQMKSLVSIPLDNAPLITSGFAWRKGDHRPALFHFLDYYLSCRKADKT